MDVPLLVRLSTADGPLMSSDLQRRLNEVGTNAVSAPADIAGVERAQNMLHDFLEPDEKAQTNFTDPESGRTAAHADCHRPDVG